MNPFTRFLLHRGQNEDHALQTFAERWDALEELVIRVFRGKEANTADETEYQQLRTWFQDNYPYWQQKWQPYWQKTLVGGQPAPQDPFQRLTTPQKAADFIGDWEA
ncbi:MAG: hypothetical protein WAM60_21960, partial [Candidatus Promineifilaceae bacterium]